MADGYYGVRITPDDGGKQLILDTGTRYMSYLATLSLNGRDRIRNIKTPPVGATPLVIPRRLVTIFPGSGTLPQMYYVTGWGLDGAGRFTYTVGGTGDGPANNIVNEIAAIDVFSVAGQASAGGWGMRITNGANFLEINDTTYLGFVTWRGVVNINGSWAIPADVLAMGAYVVYARWNNADTPLFMNRDNNRIECYTGFASAGGSGVGGTVNNVQIVIVSCGFTPQLPASGWGMVIRNAAGVVTFSSKYPPVMWRGGNFNFAGYENFDTSTGEVIQWVGVSGPVVQPMVPLCSIGIQRGDFSRSSGGFSFRPVLYAGFKMSGNAVSCARARATGSEAPVSRNAKAVQVACSLPSIDAVDYF